MSRRSPGSFLREQERREIKYCTTLFPPPNILPFSLRGKHPLLLALLPTPNTFKSPSSCRPAVSPLSRSLSLWWWETPRQSFERKLLLISQGQEMPSPCIRTRICWCSFVFSVFFVPPNSAPASSTYTIHTNYYVHA